MKIKNKITNRIIDIRSTILQALKKMDAEGVKLLFLYDKEVFKGILTIGDIQRAILAQTDLSSEVLCILDNKKIYAKPEDSIETIKSLMLSFRAECMPIVDENNILKDVFFWEDIIDESLILCQTPFDLPIVIMAGGKGTRLKPLTNVLPKPLIPIGKKTIIEDIMDEFVACGSHRFFISLNYKADFIQSYLEQQNNTAYCLTYFKEDYPLGTAGSLALIKEQLHSTFFVSNCDILIKEDYSQILHYHRENKNELTLITALKSFAIPYGIVDTGEDGLLLAIKEKPAIHFQINTGMYILEPQVLQEITYGSPMDITELIQKIMARGGRVGCFPISEKSWIDIGDWKEYNKLIH